ncbi:hypothetical protein [Niastella sp. OAS944]|uniref:hypothetical protein n=1 Tax=Niastella sp. OAS944 TaxID=2664089 RepID=UPI003482295A|nr:hypothetical protein [Chitinophagaceae bacterium OAS944]
MKKKLKLPFTELKKEVGDVISQEELRTIVGGYDDTSDSWDTEDEYWNNLYGMVTSGMLDNIDGSSLEVAWDMEYGSGSGSGAFLLFSNFGSGSQGYLVSALNGSGSSPWRPSFSINGSSSSSSGWSLLPVTGSNPAPARYTTSGGAIFDFTAPAGSGGIPHINYTDANGLRGTISIDPNSGRIQVSGSIPVTQIIQQFKSAFGF